MDEIAGWGRCVVKGTRLASNPERSVEHCRTTPERRGTEPRPGFSWLGDTPHTPYGSYPHAFYRIDCIYLVHITKDLSSNIFATCLFMVKNTGRGRLKHMSSTSFIKVSLHGTLTIMILPKERAGKSKLTQGSIWVTWTLKRGDITPALFNRPFSWTTIFPER